MTDENGRDDEANVPRAPWQRLHADATDGPPEMTDARIRAAARRDLAPRGPRWWVPASLAASFVLAVVLVRSEIGGSGRFPVTESASRGDEAMDAHLVERGEGEQAREPGVAPTAPERREAKQREPSDPDVYGYADAEVGTQAPGTGPRVGGPERELQAASEMPEERIGFERSKAAAQALDPARPSPPAPASAAPDAGGVDVTVSGERPKASAQDAAEPSAWTPPHVAAPVDNLPARSAEGRATPPTPEAWYAAIEKLRRDGRFEEAERELERLKRAYPGWLEARAAPPP